ncbi:hypothetical protein FRC08_005750 [Ceratobasidium sp. 394]|nr:hypothetical protein FRC08_005750 [Ceratobasidium sp. 394]KAG9081797.1 hypothetical protein FS749_007380 [Ceratobasidium sp. UAMH 11750]
MLHSNTPSIVQPLAAHFSTTQGTQKALEQNGTTKVKKSTTPSKVKSPVLQSFKKFSRHLREPRCNVQSAYPHRSVYFHERRARFDERPSDKCPPAFEPGRCPISV